MAYQWPFFDAGCDVGVGVLARVEGVIPGR
jgi:hypothetical protein